VNRTGATTSGTKEKEKEENERAPREGVSYAGTRNFFRFEF
jgi:hypothetical protein